MKATRAPYVLVSGQSTAANYTSPVYSVIDIDIEAIGIDYTGSPSGTFAVQGSVNYQVDNLGNVINAGTWANLYFSVNGASPASSVAVPSNATPIIFDLYGSGVVAIKVVYTGSGTGSFTATASGKRIGD
jgi:hypothetical protein